MKLITLDQARDHCKADGDDDDLIATYANAAEAACARRANRAIFATTAELTTARDAAKAALIAAYTQYDTNSAAAIASDDNRVSGMLTSFAEATLRNATVRADNVFYGIAMDTDEDTSADIIAAVLLTLGHFYVNRSGVITGQGAAAVEVPDAANTIMDRYRWVGQL